ncbi:hypothetical protein [Actinoplanes derwentensis]|nr:hypothetical protein [Actinoplanes derwentensis]GID84970.1 hypothetical protein Ade03nite_38940 [Actinoplanes derwentensis]
MINAERTGFWGRHYVLTREGGAVVTTWDIGKWASGGGFALDGREYKVRPNAWGTRYTMLDDGGAVVAEAERAGRKQWTVRAGGREYAFRRASLLSLDQQLVDGERVIGSVKRTSAWTGALAADLPGLPTAVQVFVIGIVITQWNAAAAASA